LRISRLRFFDLLPRRSLSRSAPHAAPSAGIQISERARQSFGYEISAEFGDGEHGAREAALIRWSFDVGVQAVYAGFALGCGD
jgi:hypothetical protein